MDNRIEEIRGKDRWTNDEVLKIDSIISASGAFPKRLSKSPIANIIEFDGKKYDAILKHRLFDWFDVARIVDFMLLQLSDIEEITNHSQQTPPSHSHGEKGKGSKVSEKAVTSRIGEDNIPDADISLSETQENTTGEDNE